MSNFHDTLSILLFGHYVYNGLTRDLMELHKSGIRKLTGAEEDRVHNRKLNHKSTEKRQRLPHHQ